MYRRKGRMTRYLEDMQMPKIAEIEFTPNPDARKFVLKEPLTFGVVRSYESAAEASVDDLSSRLFKIHM